ncbi:NACHT domain-containing protein [Nannocystis radixulma]|uniref:NACHT domain-containing protein n=1 Tax=Nannocystis radixulma TaxID=2995305 RepID=A0ABT5BH74_9BACT|nr:hypothetical protein [Nannocystis radixulma]MDC0673505.1 hypothetical protein [Nannocystis radixulma]
MTGRELQRLLETVDVDVQHRLVLQLPEGADLVPALSQGRISPRASADEIVGLLERHGLLEVAVDLFPAVIDTERQRRRARVLAAIRGRCDARPFVLRGLGKLRILLKDVYLEPQLRFQGARQSDELEPVGRTEGKTCAQDSAALATRQTLDAWLLRDDRARLLTVLGEMGAGKSVMLLHQEARSLQRAEEDPSAAIAFLVEAGKLARSASPSAAIAERLGLAESDVSSVLADPETRWVVLLDGADEVRSAVIEEQLEMLTRSSATAIVVTSRPVYRFPAFHGETAALVPWDESDLQRFLDMCASSAGAEVAAMRGLLNRQSLPFLANPLAATMCLLVAREESAMLGNRSRILGVLIERLFEQYARERSTTVVERPLSWAEVAPLVCELAHEFVRGELALTFENVRQLLRRQPRGVHQVHTVEGFLDSELGIFVQVDGGYEFAFRGIAEFLAGLHLLEDDAALVRAANTTWGQEPVRQAIGWIHASDSKRAAELVAGLLRGEEQECVGLQHRHLRRIIVATQVAVDLGEGMPHASLLAEAVARRLCDERSTWVGVRMAEAVRALSRVGGPVFQQLLATAYTLLQGGRRPRAGHFEWLAKNHSLPEYGHWIDVLFEREAQVRMVAIAQLEAVVDQPVVQHVLLTMLFDDGGVEYARVAYCAGHALRAALRDERFAQVREGLKGIVGLGAQIPSSAAALALRPGEAPAEALVLALKDGIPDGPRYVQAVSELAGSDEGRRLLDAHWKGWEEKLHASVQHVRPAALPLTEVPVPSAVARRNLAHALAPGLDRAASAQLGVLLADDEFAHECTHDFTAAPANVVEQLLLRPGRWSLCANAIAELAARIERDPSHGDSLLARVEELSTGSASNADFYSFPGRALEGRVRAGDAAALRAYVAWLPRSTYAEGISDGYDEFPGDICSIPEVKLALLPCIEAALSEIWRSGPAALVFARFPAVWSERPDVWAKVEGLLSRMQIPLGAEQWRELDWLLTCLRGVEIPADTRSRLNTLLAAVMTHHPAGRGDEHFFWHRKIGEVLRFIVARGLVAELAEPLHAMAGIQQPPVCPTLQLHAVCVAWPLLAPAVRIERSTYLASTLGDQHALGEIPTSELRGAIDVATDAWSKACEALVDNRGFRYFPAHSAALRIVLECLPVAARRATLTKWLRQAHSWPLPWISDEWGHNLHRPLDEAWRMLFDAGLDVEEFERLADMRIEYQGP